RRRQQTPGPRARPRPVTTRGETRRRWPDRPPPPAPHAVPDRRAAATPVARRVGSDLRSRHPLSGRAQLLRRLDDPLRQAGLGQLAPGARVVGLLVADLAVDLQHAVIVL